MKHVPKMKPTVAKVFLLLALPVLLLAKTRAENPARFRLENGKIVQVEIAFACDNLTNGGAIQGTESGCPDPFWNPGPITNLIFPTGGSGAIEYLWIFTTGDPTLPLSTWTPIQNTNAPDFDPGSITVTTHYRRCSRRAGCVDYVGETNYVTKTAECCDNITNGGSIGSDQQICGSSFDPALLENVILPSGGTGTIQYQWFQSTTGTPFDPNSPDWTLIAGANFSTFDPPSISTTTYFIRCSRRSACIDFTGKSNVVKVTLFSIPEIDTALITDVACLGGANGAIDLTITGVAPFTFDWDNNLPDVEDQSGLSAGIFNVTITDSNNCQSTAQVEVKQPATTTFTNIIWSAIPCEYESGGMAVVAAAAGNPPYTFQWDDPLSTNNDTLSGIGRGLYHVTVTDSHGCEKLDSIFIDIPLPIQIHTNSSHIRCSGDAEGQAFVTVSGGAGNQTFRWDDPNQQVGDTLRNVLAGVYVVAILDGNGCEFFDSVEITEPPTFLLSIQGIDAGCDSTGGRAIATASGGNGGLTFQWNDPAQQVNPIIINLVSGIYSLTVTDALGCVKIDSVQIGSGNNTIDISIQKTDTYCPGSSEGSATVNFTGGNAPISFQWDDLLLQTTQTATNLPKGVYHVTVTDATTCMDTATVVINELNDFSIQTFGVNENCVAAADGSVHVVASGGVTPYRFRWSDPLAQTNDTLRNLSKGNYIVTATDGAGCRLIDSVEIDVNSIIEVSINKTDANCNGASDGSATAVVQGASGQVRFAWSNNTTANPAVNLAAGNYTVTATDALGCHATATTTITQPPGVQCQALVVSNYNGLAISRFGVSDGAAAVTPSGGTSGFRYLWSTGSTDSLITGLRAGTYSVTVTDANNCSCTSAVTLENPAKIEGLVWNDFNKDGIQNGSEPGFINVLVEVNGTANSGGPIRFTQNTSSFGLYRFDALPAGSYKVKFHLPAGYIFSPQDAGGNDNIDSDANAATGETASVTLRLGDFTGFDAGISLEKGTAGVDIGDYVWFDTDRDGLQDLIEAGVPNFAVNLKNAANHALVVATQTDTLGEYLITNVPSGTYYIEFEPFNVPSGYRFTKRNAGSDDFLDSDADTISGRTPVFTIVANQADRFDLDAGIYELCDNVLDGGEIEGDEEICGPVGDPSLIRNVRLPLGGSGAIEYIWIFSHTPVFNGPGDPNWTMIPNTNFPEYDPPIISQTTYYIRCARRVGCTEFIGETNPVKKELIPLPLAEIASAPTTACQNAGVDFVATAIGGGAAYHWNFGATAVPSSSDSRVVSGVYWTATGVKKVVLTVTKFGCSAKDSVFVQVVNCFSPLGRIQNFTVNSKTATTMDLSWQTETNDNYTIFLIEKSADGVRFEYLDMVAGKTGSTLKDYFYADTKALPGENYYRLKHMDKQGNYVFSDIKMGIFDPTVARKFNVFPNPTSDKITVELKEKLTSTQQIEVLDGAGKLVAKFTAPGNTAVLNYNLSFLPNGAYYLRISDANGQGEKTKIVIQR